MEPIRHGTAVGQPQGARRRISRPHVDPMGADLLALFLREPLQALQRRRSVSATLHRQDLRPSRVAQVGHQRHVEPVPLLQAQFIQPNVGDHTLGIDLSILGQLILDDPVYRLGRDSQATGNLLRRAANQRAEHELLEAISVGHVLAFERGDNVLPVVTPRTAVEGSLVNPETGLLPQVEVPDRLGGRFELDVGDVVVATFFTAASCGQGPPHLQAMAVLISLVTGDLHLRWKVDIDGDPRSLSENSICALN